MPTANRGARSHRKRQYSCDFCRSRKLRCDRPLPCTNCISRGKRCHFGPATAGQQQSQEQQLDSAAIPAPLPPFSTIPSLPPLSTIPPLPPLALPQPAAAAAQDGLLAEIQSLRKQVEDLEKRVTREATDRRDCLSSLPTSGFSGPTSSSGLGPVSELVAHLERVSMGQSPEPLQLDDLVFKVDHIRAIPRARSYTEQLGKLARRVWLPRYDEAGVLLGVFIANLSYIHHVVHHPSLPGVVDDVYRQINSQSPVKLGHLVLFLSIVASATHIWTPQDDAGHENPLFSSSAQAHAQASLWIKATYDVLDGGKNGPPVALETVQGIIILSFLVCNLEGVSLRYRSLISTGLLLSRELGLHRIDHVSSSVGSVPNTTAIRAEMGRRVWWYLVATDWLLAARRGRPGEGVYQINLYHMAVKKPRNIDDADLVDGEPGPDLPATQPTDMSYFLQRILLAEISRGLVDQHHDSMTAITSSGESWRQHAHVVAVDAELDRMIRGMPSFFHMDSYDRVSDPSDPKTGRLFVQAYLLNSIIHTQRCKLHLGYLASRCAGNPAHASSRETCLESARQILRAESQIEKAQHRFALIRLRLSGLLYGVFMAGIVLLMDACVNGTGSQQDEIHRGEAAEALRIIENARKHSPAAANLYESLMQILAEHRTQQQQPQLVPTPIQAAARGLESSSLEASNPSCIPQDQLAVTNVEPPPFDNQLAQSLEELMEFDGFQWDALFPGAGSTPFF